MSGVALFRVCGVVIESSVPLPELPGASSDTPECCFEILPAGAGYSGDFRWLHHRRFADEDEDPWLSISRLGTDYLLRFPTQADFLVSCDGKQVRCRPLPETPESTVRHLFLDQVMPLLLSRREPLVLHASAVLTKNGAVAFAGLSGQGKSTLAAALARGGNPLLCDDCLVLRESPPDWIVMPSYPGVRLWPETADGIFPSAPESIGVAHYTSKRRVGDPTCVPFCDTPATLHSLYFLEPDGQTAGSKVSIQPVQSREAFIRLVKASQRLDITDKDALKKQFETIGRLTSGLKCYDLDYPRDFSALPMVYQAILGNVTDGEQNGDHS